MIETQFTGHGTTRTLKDMYRLLSVMTTNGYTDVERRAFYAYATIYNTITDLLSALQAIDARGEDNPDYNVQRPYAKAYNMAMQQLREHKEQTLFVEVKRIYNVAISSLEVAKRNSMK